MAKGVHAVSPSGLDAGRLESGPPDGAVDVVAVEGLVLSAGEDEVVVAGGAEAEVLGELDGDPVGQRDRAGPSSLGPGEGGSVRDELDLLLTRSRRRRNSTSLTRRPNTSPWRSPQPAAATASARYRGGSAVIIAWTWPTGQGSTLAMSILGGRTDCALQGLRAMSPSSTAAFSTEETLVSTVRTYVGAIVPWRPRSQAWITDGLR